MSFYVFIHKNVFFCKLANFSARIYATNATNATHFLTRIFAILYYLDLTAKQLIITSF